MTAGPKEGDAGGETNEMDEELLPSPILAKATLRGKVNAWGLADVEEVIEAARSAGLATLGGVAQFRLPDGICEMHWHEANASDRRPGEPWHEFVRRSADEVLAIFREKVAPVDYLAEARRGPFFHDKMRQGVDVLASLCFVLHFQAERTPAPERPRD
jgi:hypothetical protein